MNKGELYAMRSWGTRLFGCMMYMCPSGSGVNEMAAAVLGLAC